MSRALLYVTMTTAQSTVAGPAPISGPGGRPSGDAAARGPASVWCLVTWVVRLRWPPSAERARRRPDRSPPVVTRSNPTIEVKRPAIQWRAGRIRPTQPDGGRGRGGVAALVVWPAVPAAD